MDPRSYLKNGKVNVHPEIFAVVKARKPDPKAFANIVDRNETSVIIEQSLVNSEDVLEIERDWKLVTFDMILPFGLVLREAQ